MSDRLIDPFSPIQSTDDADTAYGTLMSAISANDADLAVKIATELRDSYWTRDEHRAGGAFYTGQALMRAHRYDEAKTWLQAATTGPADLAEQAYTELAELARWQSVSTHAVDNDAARHLKAAKEAFDRHDYAGAVAEAVKVFEYDDATTHDKAAASLIAGEAYYLQGDDAQGELYAGWAAQHGEGDQRGDAAALITQWKDYRAADKSMDDGVTKAEAATVIRQAMIAEGDQDHPRVIALLNELKSSGATLTNEQHDQIQTSLGDAFRQLQRYDEAIVAYQAVRDDSSGWAKTHIDDIRQMQALGEQL